MDNIIRTKDGYILEKGTQRFLISNEEAIELSLRFDRDFENDANDEEIQYQAEMVRRAKAIGL